MAANGKKLSLTNKEAWELAGKSWSVDGQTWTFASKDPNQPGQPPWKSGFEGKAFPLINDQGAPAAYAKFFNAAALSAKRIRRTQWLVEQRVDDWAPQLRGAPRLWLDTSRVSRPDNVGFDFTCSIARAVPGRTWRELKSEIQSGQAVLTDEMRWRCSEDLVRALAHLERYDMVHGDLSDNNVIVHLAARPDMPALYLIDFDAFAAGDAGEVSGLSAGEGGTIGSEGYCPPELLQRRNVDPATAIPFSDRFGRDMLLMELACFQGGCDPETAIALWSQDRAVIYQQAQRSAIGQRLSYLTREDTLALKEEQRPSSYELARTLDISLPPRVKRKSVQIAKPRNVPQLPDPQPVLSRVIFVAWLYCVAIWGLASFLLSGWLVQNAAASNGGTFGMFVVVAARGLMMVGTGIVGLAGLSMLAFARREPQVVQVAGICFRCPAGLTYFQGETSRLWLVAGQLATIAVVLSAMVGFL